MRVKDLFDLKYGVNLELIRCQETKSPEGVNFVGRTSQNNGIVARVNLINDIEPQAAGTLSCAVSGSVLSTFVQTEPYYSGRDLYVLTPKIDLTFEQKLFYALAISKNAYRYSYGRAANKTLPEIELPSMEDCNKCIGNMKVKKIHTIINVIETPFDVSSWREFYLSDIFNIIAGHYYYPDEYSIGDTPYITASNNNNAIMSRIDLQPDFKGNVITIGKVGARAHYQYEDFCATSDVNILMPIFSMNKYIGLFIKTVINFSENYKWCFGRQARIGDCKEMRIKLPVLCTGELDLKFMEDFIKQLPYSDKI